ncbi:MAG: hypothetical protein ACLP6W_15060, partial [Bryobacteraceae bacterium]
MTGRKNGRATPWRTHSCVPRRHSCRRLASRARAGVEKSLDTARTSACATSNGRVARRGSALLAVLWLSAALAAIGFSLATTIRG